MCAQEAILFEVEKALNKAFQLGEKHWQQSDSEYPSQWKKADATRDSFVDLKRNTSVEVQYLMGLEPAQKGE